MSSAAARAPAGSGPESDADELWHDVARGLAAEPRRLPPKYFYDAAGAALFERICDLDAYYLTRTETAILRAHAGAMSDAIGAGAAIIEFGSGSGTKTRLLLRALDDAIAYIPVDISCAQLHRFATRIAEEFPALEVRPICADYTRAFALPTPARTPRRTLAFFPGSTIGNFEEADAAEFLRRVADLCGEDGLLLLGFDLHKDSAILDRAYDDEAGVTAEFNLNLLRRINRECGTDFDTDAFRHHAFYDEPRGRIEMRLVSTRPSTVTLPARPQGGAPRRFHFRTGDFIITEYSHKYTLAGMRDLAARTGWHVQQVWTDADEWFAVALLRVRRL